MSISRLFLLPGIAVSFDTNDRTVTGLSEGMRSVSCFVHALVNTSVAFFPTFYRMHGFRCSFNGYSAAGLREISIFGNLEISR